MEQVRDDIRARPDKNGTTFEDVFDDFIQAQLDAGRAPSYVQNYRKTMTSWLRHNSLPFFDLRKLNMGDVRSTPTIEDESLPSPDQLRRVISRATLRGRAIIGLVAFAGLRFEVLGNNEGTDGLRLKDLPDFEVGEGKVTVRRTPARVKVRAKLSKTRRRYFSFLTAEGAEMVRVYLQDRLDRGEELTQDSPIIRCTPGREFGGRRVNGANYGSPFIVSRNIAREVKRSFGKEIRSRPYVLRSFFNTTLLIARSRAGMPPRDYRTFWMGHVGDIEATYSMNKHPTPEFIEEQRRAFEAAEPYLSASPEGAVTTRERMERESAEREELVGRMESLESLSKALIGLFTIVNPDAADKVAQLDTPLFREAIEGGGSFEITNPKTGDTMSLDARISKSLLSKFIDEGGEKMSVTDLIDKHLDIIAERRVSRHSDSDSQEEDGDRA